MKLNLVPTHVAKEKASGGAIFVMFLLIIVGIIGAVLMVVTSNSALANAKSEEATALSNAAGVKAISDQADALMADAKTHAVVRNVSLAAAMEAHSTVYPDLYDMIRRYVPSYYRVTSMAASSAGDNACTVTLTGVLTTYQQYADLGLAFMRIPGAVGYSPSGYQLNDLYVPNLTPDDMRGRRIRPGDTNVPDDEQQRLAYLIQQGTNTRYLGSGYGDDTVTEKGAMPNASLVTITITLQGDAKHHYDLQTPDPRSTLSQATTAAATSTAGGAAGGFGVPPPQGGNPPAAAKASGG
ncbi:MAG: hypothetical protein ACYC96_07790 [Fimbriimonadaceae bacterium]